MLLCILSCSIKVRTYKSATQAVLYSCTDAWPIIVLVITHAGFIPYRPAGLKLLNNFIIFSIIAVAGIYEDIAYFIIYEK